MKSGSKLYLKGYDGFEYGPFRWTEVREWVALGYLTHDDQVRPIVGDTWVRVDAIPTLLAMPPSTEKSESFIYVRAKAAEKVPVGPRAQAYLNHLGCPIHPSRLNPYTASRWVAIMETLRPHLKIETESWAADEERLGRVPRASPNHASEKQVAYLRSIGHRVTDDLTKAQAQLLFSGPPTEGQMRRIRFYGLTLAADASKDEASAAIDRYVRDHPESEAAYQNWKSSVPAEPSRRRWWKSILGLR